MTHTTDYHMGCLAGRVDVPDRERPYYEHAMQWSLERGASYSPPPGEFSGSRKDKRRRRKEVRKQRRRMINDCAASLERHHNQLQSRQGEYGFIGLILGAFATAFFTKIATIVIDYWWSRWGLPE